MLKNRNRMSKSQMFLQGISYTMTCHEGVWPLVAFRLQFRRRCALWHSPEWDDWGVEPLPTTFACGPQSRHLPGDHFWWQISLWHFDAGRGHPETIRRTFVQVDEAGQWKTSGNETISSIKLKRGWNTQDSVTATAFRPYVQAPKRNCRKSPWVHGEIRRSVLCWVTFAWTQKHQKPPVVYLGISFKFSATLLHLFAKLSNKTNINQYLP